MSKPVINRAGIPASVTDADLDRIVQEEKDFYKHGSLGIAGRIDNETKYSGTLTEESLNAAIESFRNRPPRSAARPPLVIVRNTTVYVSKGGIVTVFGLFSSKTSTKEDFKQAFGVELGDKNDYFTTLGELLPEEFWQKGKDNDLRSNI